MRVAVAVTPKSGKDAVMGWVVDANGERELSVKVTAAPEKGKATKAVCKLLAAFFDVPKSSWKRLWPSFDATIAPCESGLGDRGAPMGR